MTGYIIILFTVQTGHLGVTTDSPVSVASSTVSILYVPLVRFFVLTILRQTPLEQLTCSHDLLCAKSFLLVLSPSPRTWAAETRKNRVSVSARSSCSCCNYRPNYSSLSKIKGTSIRLYIDDISIKKNKGYYLRI